MSRPFLQDMPLEIREHIYRDLFESPSGLLFLIQSRSDSTRLETCFCNPSDYSETRYRRIDLSLLLVCRQIYEECKSFVWKYNSIVLGPSDRCIQSERFRRVQHVRLELDMSFAALLQATRDCFEMLGKWAKDGSLKTITLHAVKSREMMECLVEVRGVGKQPYRLYRGFDPEIYGHTFQSYLTLLRGSRGDNESPLGLGTSTRKVLVDVGWNDRFSRSSQEAWLGRVVGLENVQEITRDIHEAFGGELWQDGVLCWKDHVQVAEAFKLAAPTQH